MCIFHNESYIHLLKLLLNSISSKANIDNNTDILIVTSSEFQPTIEELVSFLNLQVKYYIIDLESLFEASCAKLRIFNYEFIASYDKILYLDTDVLIINDINTIFNLEINSDKIYAIEEGFIGDNNWGAQFFDFSVFNKSFPAFSAGVLYFHNTPVIQKLFKEIRAHIDKYVYLEGNEKPFCLDQPFVVYNAIIQNKYDNQLLKPYLKNNPDPNDPNHINKELIICHYPGHPGEFESKSQKMTYSWHRLKFF
jgi:hypothetical protein